MPTKCHNSEASEVFEVTEISEVYEVTEVSEVSPDAARERASFLNIKCSRRLHNRTYSG